MRALRAGLGVLGIFGGLPIAAACLESGRMWAGVIAGALSLALMTCGVGAEWDGDRQP